MRRALLDRLPLGLVLTLVWVFLDLGPAEDGGVPTWGDVIRALFLGTVLAAVLMGVNAWRETRLGGYHRLSPDDRDRVDAALRRGVPDPDPRVRDVVRARVRSSDPTWMAGVLALVLAAVWMLALQAWPTWPTWLRVGAVVSVLVTVGVLVREWRRAARRRRTAAPTA
ncbi:hypothetical protein [Mobilicoccus pelagius]|uniref:Uncharacterized protein n=1 Tax=Mobilicoccus pelagius NBRC 104925 TaxID=1089455 RepID=H5UUJ7_9MICO|nr:hypothetical protein [Mobilicoccus pelagius]GAB49405.1 hypothetical protein MOPEL_130_00120 [Mobilicoccus pelagius NBRC 104925]